MRWVRNPPVGELLRGRMTVMAKDPVGEGKGIVIAQHDLLDERDVPSGAYWGVHTLRAVENFPITGVPVGHFSNFVRALVSVKQGDTSKTKNRSLVE